MIEDGRAASAIFHPPSSMLVSKMPGRLISRTSPFEGDRDGANPSPAANHSPLAQNQSGSLTNCGRWRVTNTGYQSLPRCIIEVRRSLKPEVWVRFPARQPPSFTIYDF